MPHPATTQKPAWNIPFLTDPWNGYPRYLWLAGLWILVCGAVYVYDAAVALRSARERSARRAQEAEWSARYEREEAEEEEARKRKAAGKQA